MSLQLVVVRPFSSFARGDVISDAARVEKILSSENARSVVRVVVPPAKGE